MVRSRRRIQAGSESSARGWEVHDLLAEKTLRPESWGTIPELPSVEDIPPSLPGSAHRRTATGQYFLEQTAGW